MFKFKLTKKDPVFLNVVFRLRKSDTLYIINQYDVNTETYTISELDGIKNRSDHNWKRNEIEDFLKSGVWIRVKNNKINK